VDNGLIAGDAAVADPQNTSRVPGNIFFVGNHNQSVAF
jgi:hypothetical protein